MKTKNSVMPWPAVCLSICLLWSWAISADAEEFKAKLTWSKRVELGTPVKGVIKEVNVQVGDQVKKNSVLLKLDQRPYKSRISALEARLRNFEALRDEAKREFDRALELYDRTVLSDHELQVAENNFISAESAYKVTKAELNQAQLDLEYSVLRAPFDALVIKRYAEVGQTVVPELKPQVLLVLARAGRMIARAEVKEKKMELLQRGQQLEVIVQEQHYTGRISSIGLEPIEGDSEKYYLDVEFDTGGRIFRAGQQAVIKQ